MTDSDKEAHVGLLRRVKKLNYQISKQKSNIFLTEYLMMRNDASLLPKYRSVELGGKTVTDV